MNLGQKLKSVGWISIAHPPFCAGSVDALRLSTLRLGNIDDWGGDLTPRVAETMPDAIRIGLEELAAWAAKK